MQLYLSLKAMPELRHRSWKERRQVAWQAGLKPYRHWQVWATLALTSLVALWGLDTFVGNMAMYPDFFGSNKGFASALTVLLAIVIPAAFAFLHAYLKALRPYIRHVSFDPSISWWRAAIKGLLPDLVFILLFLACVAAIDWAINSYDETPDPRIAAIQSWPEPIPDENNGFIAANGLLAPPGTSPFEAGQRWVAAYNDAILKHAKDFPAAPKGLKYTAYLVPGPKPDPERKGEYARFCNSGNGACLNIVHQEKPAVEAWVAANQELLTRYLSLRNYLQWQYALKQGDASSPLPIMDMVRPQSLMHAAALLAIEKGQTGKGLDMLADDIRFCRNRLASKDMLIGKMIATIMLAKDLAVLAEIIGERPNDLKSYWPQIEKMLSPLTPGQLSTADAFRFEERWILAITSPDAPETDNPLGSNIWSYHHFKKAATANLMIRFWERVIDRTDVRDASFTPPMQNENSPEILGISRVTGFMHNLGGIVLALIAVPDYTAYANRSFDLNAMNNLLRLQMALAKNNVSGKDVPAFLNNGDKTLWNPETGKPFEWDAERKQVYFAPATDNFRNRFTLGSGVSGRAGFVVADAAAPEVIAKQGK